MIGEVIGSYRIVSRIGAGGMGEVWLAEHHLLGSKVAIKVLLPEMSRQKKIVQRFFAEAKAATRIQDPGIVSAIDFGWRDDTAYLIMEYLVGESLAKRLEREDRIPVHQAARLVQLCAMAMGAAHAAGIVHRDLKPDNIYLVSDPAVPGGERIKILDFGIAKLLGDTDEHRLQTQTGVILGTPAFMSPEQCRGSGAVDHRSDIYSLGCVLFDMLCGRPPFTAKTTGEMIASHLREDPPIPSALVPGLTPELDRMVRRCLEKDVEQRYQSMTEVVRAASVITGENQSIQTIPPMRAKVTGDEPTVADRGRHPATPATAAPATAATASATTPPRRRGGAVILVGAVLVVAAAVVTAALRWTNSDAGTAPPASTKPVAATADAATATSPRPLEGATTVTPDAATAAAAADATTVTTDAATMAAIADAATTTLAPSLPDAAVTAVAADAAVEKPTSRPKGTKPPRVTKPPAQGSGAAAGSGSATKPYSPYEER